MKNKTLVVKDNRLINAGYRLELAEQRLILLAIFEAREKGMGITSDAQLSIHADRYIKQFGVEPHTAYEMLQTAARQLFDREFRYENINEKGNVEIVTSRWVSEIRYVKKTATVKIVFAPSVVPLISRLEKQFTSYELEQVSQFTSIFAIRLYELLIAWKSTGQTPVFTLDDFRNKIGIAEGQYTRMDNLKTKVLDIAKSQINEHSDIIVDYEQHKTGRTITGLSFSFKLKESSSICPLSSSKPKMEKETPALENKVLSKTVKPVSAFSGLEKVLFLALKRKCATLTETQIVTMAKSKNIDIFLLLQTLTNAYQTVDHFEI